jgi:hypothetical protein
MYAAAGSVDRASQPGRPLDLDRALALPGFEAGSEAKRCSTERTAGARRHQDHRAKLNEAAASISDLLLVFFGSARDPRGRRDHGQVGNWKGADARAFRSNDPVRSGARRRLHWRPRLSPPLLGSRREQRSQRPDRQGCRQGRRDAGRHSDGEDGHSTAEVNGRVDQPRS